MKSNMVGSGGSNETMRARRGMYIDKPYCQDIESSSIVDIDNKDVKGDHKFYFMTRPSHRFCFLSRFSTCLVLLFLGFLLLLYWIKPQALVQVAEGQHEYVHKHAIPNLMYFTYSYNLLEAHVKNNFRDDEDIRLANNVRNTITLHPDTRVIFMTDADCLSYIREVGIDSLDKFFIEEEKGMIKADICRGAALYKTGGLYFDVDIQARENVWNFIDSGTEFVVPLVHKDHKVKGSFFQAFIATTARNPIMFRYLEMFVEYYEGKRTTKTPSVGVVLLREAYDEVNNNRMRDSTVFWQEIRYNKESFPDIEPTYGERRACHMIVYIPQSSVVPFYSRVRGSRMCGGRDSKQTP